MKISLSSLSLTLACTLAACAPRDVDNPTLRAPARQGLALFTNGGFEADAINDPPSGWTVQARLNPGLAAVPPTSEAQLALTAGGNLNTVVVGDLVAESQPDPELGAGRPLRYPKFGTRSGVVNEGTDGNNRNTNIMRQTTTLTLADVDPNDGNIHVRFVAAPVLQNPGHADAQQPYFFIQLRNVTQNKTLYTNFNFAGQAGVPWQSYTPPGDDTIQFTDWQLVDIAPPLVDAAIGDDVELMVVAAGCSLGGHWGHVYVDAFGASIPGLFVSATGPATAVHDTDITYNIVYSNGGSGPADNTIFTFTTPPNTTFQSVGVGGCTTPAVGATGTVTCNLGTVLAGASLQFDLTVHIDNGTSGLVTASNYSISADTISPLIGSKVDTDVTGPASIISTVSGTPQSANINAAFGAPLVARVTDGAGHPISGVLVTYSAPSNGASASFNTPAGTSDGSGLVSVNATANASLGSYGVLATAAGIVTPATFSLTNNTTGPATVTRVSGTGQTTTVLTSFAQPLVVEVRDASGNVLPGVTVNFTGPLSGAGATFTGPFVTGSNGRVSVTAAANSTAGGPYTVNASVSGVVTPATFSLTNTPGAPAAISIVGGDNQSTVVRTGFASSLSVLVVDAQGNPVPGATVVYSAPSSGASAGLTGSPITNASGIATVSATANPVAGFYAVTAQVLGVGTVLSFNLINTPSTPASVTITNGDNQSTVVLTAFAAPLALHVTDADGNPLAGIAVTFTASLTSANVSSLTSTLFTNSAGDAFQAVDANAVAGAHTVTATVGGAGSVVFNLTNTPSAAANIVAFGGSGQSTTVLTAFASPLQVRVTDAQNNPIPNATVNFAPPATGATATISGTLVTDAQGEVSVGATAGATAGSYTFSATSPGVVGTADFTLTNNPASPATIEIVTGNNQSAAVTTALASPLVARVRDAQGNTVDGAQVLFLTQGGATDFVLSQSTVTTSGGGLAQVTATAGTHAGASQVIAALASGPFVTFDLTTTAGAPATIAIAGGGVQSATVSTAFSAPLAVVVKDLYDNPVSGATVTWTPPGAGASATPSASSSVTDSSGATSVTALANATAGSYGVVAALAGGEHVSFTLTNRTNAPVSIIAESGSGQSTTVLTPFGAPLVVRVTSNGQPVANALVTFLVPMVGPRATLSSVVVATDATGHAQINATAADVSGSYAVTASVPGAMSPAVFSLTNNAGAAASIIASPASTPQTAQVGSFFGTRLTAIVKDAAGNAVEGVTVDFAAPGSSPTANLGSTSATTDAQGRASVFAFADSVAGSYTVDATSAGVIGTASFDLTNSATAPLQLVLVSGTPQSAAVGVGFGSQLQVQVLDGSGNPVPGASVSYTDTGSLATADLSASPAVSDPSGLASIPVTANNRAGTYEILAFTPGAAAPVRFTLTNVAGAPSTLVVVPNGATQSTIVQTPFSLPLAVRIEDAFGNPVEGAGVSFTPPLTGASSVLSASTAVTDGNGIANVIAIANDTTGTYLVNASSGVLSGDFSLTNLPDDPVLISITSGGTQTTLATTQFPNPLVVHVTDVFGNPVPNAPISFTYPATGASATGVPTVPVTDGNGDATIVLTANGTPGTYDVSISTANSAVPAIASLTNRPIPTTTTLTYVPEDPTVDRPITLTATVVGEVGIPIGQVRFIADGVVLGTAALADRTASLELIFPAVGLRSLVAEYDAQGSFDASASTPQDILVGNDSGSLNGGGGCGSVPGGTSGSWLGLLLLAALALRRGGHRVAGALGAVAVAGMALAPGSARAQTTGTSVATFHTAAAGSDWFSADSLDLRGHGRASMRALMDYGHDPLVVYNADLTRRNVVIREQLWLNVGASVNLWDRLRLSANLPALLHQFSRPVTFNGDRIDPGAHSGIGDIRLAADVRLVGEYGGVAELAVGLAVGIPTGLRNELLGEGRATFVPRLAFAGAAGPMAYAAQLAYATRGGRIGDVNFNGELRYNAALGVRFASNKLLVGPELFGLVDIGPSAGQKRPAGLEVDLGIHYQFVPTWRASLGVGTSAVRSPGYPNFRALASFQWTTPFDTAPDTAACKQIADRDDDGVLDGRDMCPDVPAGVHGDGDRPGCPEGDADKDGVLDHADLCKDVPAGDHPNTNKPGCPDADSDHDGVLDSADQCPAEPQGGSADPARAGCPLPDRDGDRVPDAQDACPDQPGAPNADSKKNGCSGLAIIEKSRIVLLKPVLFATNKDVILEKSFPVLQAVADTLRATPDIKQLSIEGHTDSQGSAPKNLLLSQRRAQSVRKWLADHGVEAERLTTEGFGPSKPLETNDTAAGRAINRRVEFRIIEQ